MPPKKCSLSALRSALNRLYEPKALRSSPLLAMLGAEPSAVSTLRDALIKAIESMKPAPGAAVSSLVRQNYEILYYRYVQQSSQQEVADQLGVSLRHLKREQGKALDALAQRLCERHGVQFDGDGDDEPNVEMEADLESAVTAVEGDLRWLKRGAEGLAVEVGEILPGILDLAQPLAQRHQARLKVLGSEEMPRLAVHAVALRQTLLSLLSVAVRQAPGGRVTVSVHRLPRHVEIRVEAKTIREHSPLDPADEANIAVARRLADACGGSLKVQHTDVFVASLALPAADQATVLVVDDNLDAVRLVRRYTQDTRYRVLDAQHAEQALALARESPPQVILLDLMMPEVDGWELLGRLKQHPLTSQIPVIACTILAQEELAFTLGVSAFLRKPFTRQELLAALDHLLGQAGP